MRRTPRVACSVSAYGVGRIGNAVPLSSPIHPVTATSICDAFARRLESLRASHGPVNAHSSVRAVVRGTCTRHGTTRLKTQSAPISRLDLLTRHVN